ADTAPVWNVDAGFDGSYVTCLQHSGAGWAHEGDFVNEQADTMADASVDVLFVFGALHSFGGFFKYVLQRHASLHHGQGIFHHALFQLINFSLLFVGLAHNHSSGHVGHVAVHLATKVHQDEIAISHSLVRWDA